MLAKRKTYLLALLLASGLGVSLVCAWPSYLRWRATDVARRTATGLEDSFRGQRPISFGMPEMGIPARTYAVISEGSVVAPRVVVDRPSMQVLRRAVSQRPVEQVHVEEEEGRTVLVLSALEGGKRRAFRFEVEFEPGTKLGVVVVRFRPLAGEPEDAR